MSIAIGAVIIFWTVLAFLELHNSGKKPCAFELEKHIQLKSQIHKPIPDSPDDESISDGNDLTTQSVSINRDEAVIVVDKIGRVRISFLDISGDNRIRLGITSPMDVRVYRRDKKKKELAADERFFKKEIEHWRKEVREYDRKQKDLQELVLPHVEKALLDNKSTASIARKYKVDKEYVQRVYERMAKAGRFDMPLFE